MKHVVTAKSENSKIYCICERIKHMLSCKEITLKCSTTARTIRPIAAIGRSRVYIMYEC